MEYRTSTVVEADADAVWAVFADVERLPEHTPTMTRVTVLDGAGLRVGARVRIVQPRLPPATWEVTALEPGRSFTWESAAPGLHSVATHVVESLGPGRSRLTLTIAQTGALGFVAAALGSMTRRYLDTELAAVAAAAG